MSQQYTTNYRWNPKSRLWEYQEGARWKESVWLSLESERSGKEEILASDDFIRIVAFKEAP